VKTRIAVALAITSTMAASQSFAISLNESTDLALSATVVSDYRSLGVSQTHGDPALQLQAIVSHSSGLYAGLWSSNVDFGSKTRREDGYYVGYSYAVNDDINLTGSIGRYEYPREASFDTNEFYAEANIYKVKLGYIYDFGVDNDVPDLTSYFVGYTFDLPYESSLYMKYGYTDYNFDLYTSSGDTRQTYYDWEVTLSKQVFGVDLAVSYLDTDLSKTECLSSMGADDVCSATVVVAATKTF
jgi:uncharacterized protein (TIGR02001 family)